MTEPPSAEATKPFAVDLHEFADLLRQRLVARQADGYGGVMVQSCVIDGETVTVLYGHLAFTLSSIQIIPGTHLEAGQTFATLGTAFSNETDGERQHLHLSIHKGTAAVLAGYVQTEKELDAWIDPMTILAR